MKSTLRVCDPIIANVHYLWHNVNDIQDKRLHFCRKHFVNNIQGVIFWLPLWNLYPWASYPMILIIIFPNIPSNLLDLHWPMALSTRLNLNKYYLHFHVIAMYWFKVINVTIIVRLRQDINWQSPGFRNLTLHVWAFCPKQWWAFCPVCTFSPSQQTQKCWYWQVKWNRTEIKEENDIIQCKNIAISSK